MSTARIQFPAKLKPLLRPARYKGVYGGRGGAKSHFFSGLLIVRTLNEPGLRAVCVREVQNTIKESVKRLLEDKIRDYGASAHFRIKESEIETPGGGIIIFRGMQHYKADNIKSLEGYDVCWVEEAHALSQKSLDLLRPTIRKPGSELWFSWNPGVPSDPIDAFLRSENPPQDSIVIGTTWRDNPWFPKELLEEKEWYRLHDPVRYQHIWEGEYQARLDALVFSNWRVETFDTPADARFYFGGDWGFAKDPSVLIRAFIDGRKLYVDHEVFQVGCEIIYLPFLFGGCNDEGLQKLSPTAWQTLPAHYKKWQGIPGARAWPSIVDSARPETISHMQRHGFPKMEAARKGPGSVEEGIEFLRSYEIIVHPRCKHTIEELSSYSYKTDRLTDEVLPALEDAKNHGIDSLRYAVEKVRRAQAKMIDTRTGQPIRPDDRRWEWGV